MSEFTITVLRFALFALLWLFVFLIARALRHDLFGSRTLRARRARKRETVGAQGGHHSVAAGSGPPPGPPPGPGSSPGSGPGSGPSHGSAPVLVLTSGSQAGMSLMLGTGQLTIGRADDSGLIIDDDYASSRHARIYPQAGSWVLEDTNSTNGTYMQGSRLTGPVRLGPGSQFTIGSTTMELRA